MRISHLQALADIVLGDPEALALAYHETINAAGPIFDCDAARDRFAVALKAVGMVICPLLSGPKLMIFWTTKEI